MDDIYGVTGQQVGLVVNNFYIFMNEALKKALEILKRTGNFIAPKTAAAGSGAVNTAGMIKDFIEFNTAKDSTNKQKQLVEYNQKRKGANDAFKQFGFDANKEGNQFDPGQYARGVTAGGGELASYASPMGGGLKARMAINAVPGITDAFSKGKNMKDTAIEGALTALMGTGGERAFKTIGKFARPAISKGMDLLTGTPIGTFERATLNSKSVGQAMRGQKDIMPIVQKARSALSSLEKNTKDQYGKDFKKIVTNTSGMDIPIKEVKDGLLDIFNKYGAKVTQPVSESQIATGILDASGKPIIKTESVLGNISFDKSSISDSREISALNSLVKDINTWDDTSLEGVNILKQRLQNAFRPTASNRFNAIVTDLSNKIDDLLTDKVPELGRINKEFSGKTELATNIGKKIDSTSAEGAISNLLGKNKTETQALFKELEKQGGTNIIDEIKDVKTGQSLSGIFPSTGSRTQDVIRSILVSGAGGLVGGPAGAIAGLAATSPRVMGEIATRTAPITSAVGNVIPQEGLQKIMQLLGIRGGENISNSFSTSNPQVENNDSQNQQFTQNAQIGNGDPQNSMKKLVNQPNNNQPQPEMQGAIDPNTEVTLLDGTKATYGQLQQQGKFTPAVEEEQQVPITDEQFQQLFIQDLIQNGGKNLDKLTTLQKLISPQEDLDTQKKQLEIQALQKEMTEGKPLGSEEQKMANNATSGLRSLQDIEQTLGKDAENPLMVLPDFLGGNQSYQTSKENLTDVIGRLRSGGAIGTEEEKRFKKLLPNSKKSADTNQKDLAELKKLLAGFIDPRNAQKTNEQFLMEYLGQ